jgi:hypothetical protein
VENALKRGLATPFAELRTENQELKTDFQKKGFCTTETIKNQQGE